MFLRCVLMAFLVVGMCSADTLILRNGSMVQGSYLGGTSRQIKFVVDDQVRTYDVGDVKTLRFGIDVASKAPVSAPATTAPIEAAATAAPALAASPAPVAAAAAETSQRREPVTILRPERVSVSAPKGAAASRRYVEIPSGSQIVVRMIDDVDSERDQVGQTFRASIDEPIVLNGETVVPRGADVVAKLIDEKQSGRLTGTAELTLDLVSLTVNGKTIDMMTQEVTQASKSRTGQTAKVAGGTAALGAIIGAIAGGGTGAAIGAVAGAGAGGAVQVLTKGQRVKIPSETRLTFTIQQPLRI